MNIEPANNSHIITLSIDGFESAKRLKDSCFNNAKIHVGKKTANYLKSKSFETFTSIFNLTNELWAETDLLIYLCGAAIAVRSIAPLLNGKFDDPAVIVCSEDLRFAVPLLGGHYRQANAFASFIEDKLHAKAVLTSSSDVKGMDAFDSFAARQGMEIENSHLLKDVLWKMSSGIPIKYFCNSVIKGSFAENVTKTDMIDEADLYIGERLVGREDMLILRPKSLSVGVGCRKGVDAGLLIKSINSYLEGLSLSPLCLKTIAAPKIKENEKAIIDAANHFDAEFKTFSKEKVNSLQNVFKHSKAAETNTGYFAACEPCAYLAAAPNVEQHFPKQTFEGSITISAAVSSNEILRAGNKSGVNNV